MNAKTKVANCDVLGAGDNPQDPKHVRKQTPLETERKELLDDPRYTTEFGNGVDPVREAAVTKARRDGSVRPLDGGGAKRN